MGSSSFIDTIQQRLAKITNDDLVAPTRIAGEEVTIVGEMPKHLQHLETLRKQLANEFNILTAKNPRKLSELWVKAREIELVESIFWFDVKTAFPELADKAVVSVYAGWKVGWKEVDVDTALGVMEAKTPSEIVGTIAGLGNTPDDFHDLLFSGTPFSHQSS